MVPRSIRIWCGSTPSALFSDASCCATQGASVKTHAGRVPASACARAQCKHAHRGAATQPAAPHRALTRSVRILGASPVQCADVSTRPHSDAMPAVAPTATHSALLIQRSLSRRVAGSNDVIAEVATKARGAITARPLPHHQQGVEPQRDVDRGLVHYDSEERRQPSAAPRAGGAAISSSPSTHTLHNSTRARTPLTRVRQDEHDVVASHEILQPRHISEHRVRLLHTIRDMASTDTTISTAAARHPH